MSPDRFRTSARERLLEQQAAVAEFGCYALESEDLDAVLRKSCELAARGLGVEIAKVLEARPGGTMLLRAAVGIPPAVATIGVTEIPGDGGSAAGYAVETGKPVISDIATETRFEVSHIVRALGVRTSVNVIIAGSEGPYGALEVDAMEPRAFSRDEVSFLQTYANLVSSAVERQRYRQRLSEMAAQRTLLLDELQHRTSNDFQMIIAILTLEAGRTASQEVRDRLDSVLGRLDVLRLMHDRLAATGAIDRVDLSDYLAEICQARLRVSVHEAGENGIDFLLDLQPVAIDRTRAVPFGLIANEFVTNSLKYAFPLGKGRITVKLDRPANDRLRLILADDGIGLERGPSRGSGSLGMRLLDLLVRELQAQASWDTGNGTRLELVVPA